MKLRPTLPLRVASWATLLVAIASLTMYACSPSQDVPPQATESGSDSTPMEQTESSFEPTPVEQSEPVADEPSQQPDQFAQENRLNNLDDALENVWQWTKMVTPVDQIEVPSPENYTVKLTPDGMAYFQIDCNQGQGTFSIGNGTISFGPIAATKMACPEGTLDHQYVTYLGQVTSFFVEGDALYMELPVDGGTMHFRRGGSEVAAGEMVDPVSVEVDVSGAEGLLSPDETLVVLDVPVGGSEALNDKKIEGYKSESFAVAVPAGATLRVEMKTDSSSAYYNIHDVRDQSGAAVHRGEFDGANALLEAGESTTYLIRPFLVRAAARRNESASYTMTVDVTKDSEQVTEGQDSNQYAILRGGPANYDATGICKCSAGADTFDALCEFRVQRGEVAIIWIVNPAKPDELRIFNFEGSQQDPSKGVFTTSGSEELSWQRQDDNWWVGVDGKEFYLIPDALIWGG